MRIFLCLAACIVVASAETCSSPVDCKETQCNMSHGWFLQCKQIGGVHACVCSHLSFVGKNCTTGMTSECETLHGSQCQDKGLHWVCADNQCHCTRYGG